MKDNKKRRKAPILIIAIAAIVIIAGAHGFDFGSNDRGSDSSDPSGDSVTISDGLNEIMSEDDFRNSDPDVRAEMIEKYLYDAADNERTDEDGNTIVRDSIEEDEADDAYIYTDSDGGINVVKYEEDDAHLERKGVSKYETPEENPVVRDTEGILLYALDRGGSQFEKDCKSFVDDLKTQGSECEMDSDVTVKDYETSLEGNDYVIIESHGSMLNYGYGFKNESSEIVPVICTREDITEANKQQYAEDISEQRVAKVTVLDKEEPGGTAYRYWILPSFFTKHYSSDKLDGTYVHMGNCCGFGSESRDNSDGEDHALANSFTSCGASAVTGYYNSVFTMYDSGMSRVIMGELLSGNDLDDAVDSAKEEYGDDDKEYAKKQGWLDPASECYPSASEKIEDGTAYIVIKGDDDFNFRDSESTSDREENEPPGAKGAGYIIGEWVAYDEDLPEDDLIGPQRLVFNDDLTGYTYFRAGSFEFTYEQDDDGTVRFTDNTISHQEYKVIIDDDNQALTLYYPSGSTERYYPEE